VPLIDDASSRIPRAVQALRYRDFRLLIVGLFLALSGWWMVIVAQGWLAFELTNRASAVALVSAMLSFPFLALGPFSGVLADRLYRKHLLVVTRSSIAVLMFFEGVLIVGGWIQIWHMMVLALLSGCAFAMDIPARQSLIPDTVPRSIVANAVAISTSIFSGTTIVGPMIGAAILGFFGPGGCFLANGVGNVALASAIFFMRIPRRQRLGRFDVIGDLKGAFEYVRREPVVLMLLSVALVITLTTRSWEQLAPVFVREVYGRGEGSLGALYSAAGI
jgi:MFS family permease